MAHGMMGFFGATLMTYGCQVLCQHPMWALAFIVIPFLKDLTDYQADLAKSSPIFAIQPFHLREMRLDALTDNLFWNTGALLALLLATAQAGKGVTFAMLLGLIAIFSVLIFRVALKHYSMEKDRFDKAALPFFFRLPTFTGNPAAVQDVPPNGPGLWQTGRAEAVAAVENFAYGGQNGPGHLIVDGPSGTRKTPLVVGIGSAATVRGGTVRYLSQSTLIEEIQSCVPQKARADTEPLAPWEADLIVVDDVVAPVTATQIPTCLRRKRTVWVTTGGQPASAAVAALRGHLHGPMQVIRLDQPDPTEALSGKPVPLLLRILAIVTPLVAGILLLGSLGLVIYRLVMPVAGAMGSGTAA
jgi:hypothetical protein